MSCRALHATRKSGLEFRWTQVWLPFSVVGLAVPHSILLGRMTGGGAGSCVGTGGRTTSSGGESGTCNAATTSTQRGSFQVGVENGVCQNYVPSSSAAARFGNAILLGTCDEKDFPTDLSVMHDSELSPGGKSW
jgi:hypothetical protein